MSTFDGLVAEFPDIRVDFFRSHATAPPPLACFLSHVHSDHLAGLEGLRSPFVYCSAATKEMLLRLERYPCRINYAQGILEARQQTYKHLGRVLKPLPLETPTVIELQPGHSIQVTLFDANHCPGAVMFLIECGGKAVLYTGDVRCEPWFVNALARNPILIEYTRGLRTLDKLYLDTSFIANVPFQPKADGIAELLRNVSRYPKDTVFHLQAWTYGYEDVWVALSRALNSPIHVDDYKMQVYGALRSRPEKQSAADHHLAAGAAALTGHMCGNTPHPGCLTSDQNVRLHSCEKGNMCAVARDAAVVKIQPVVARLPSGESLIEAGVGGGGEDLEREAELNALQDDVVALLELISSSDSITEPERDQIRKLLRDASESGRELMLKLDAAGLRDGQSADVGTALCALSRQRATPDKATVQGLPKVIQFPYSRHSSYPELCHLVRTLQPRDVWPCTVDRKQWMADGISIRSLFGESCSGQVFAHDLKMAAFASAAAPMPETQVAGSQQTDSAPRQDPSVPWPPAAGASTERMVSPLSDSQPHGSHSSAADAHGRGCRQASDASSGEHGAGQDTDRPRKRKHLELSEAGDEGVGSHNSQRTSESLTGTLTARHSVYRAEAYYTMLGNAADQGWRPITLLSTDGSHSVADKEL